MFLRIDVDKNQISIYGGEVIINFNAKRVTFTNQETEVTVKPTHVHAHGRRDSEGKMIDFETVNPLVVYPKSGVWSKVLKRNGVDIQVSVVFRTPNRYELSIGCGHHAVIYSKLRGKPTVIITGDSERWCEGIIAFLKGGEENE